MRAFLLSMVHIPHLWFQKWWRAPLPPRFRNFLNESVKAITLLPRVHTFSIVTTNAPLSVLVSTSDLHNSRWRSGEICPVLSTGAFTLFCHDDPGFTEDLISPFVTFLCYCFVVTSQPVTVDTTLTFFSYTDFLGPSRIA